MNDCSHDKGRDAYEHLAAQINGALCTVIMVPAGGRTDVRFTLELGLSVMADKPLILAIQPGAVIPERLAKLADEIVELNTDDPRKAHASIARAVDRIIEGEL